MEHYVKQRDGRWLLTDAHSLDETIELVSIHCVLALRDVYDKVEGAG